MHPLRNLMSPALQNHPPTRIKMNAHIRAVDLLLHDQRSIRDKSRRLLPPQMLVIIGPLRPKQVRGTRILDKIISGGAHKKPKPIMDPTACETSSFRKVRFWRSP